MSSREDNLVQVHGWDEPFELQTDGTALLLIPMGRVFRRIVAYQCDICGAWSADVFYLPSGLMICEFVCAASIADLYHRRRTGYGMFESRPANSNKRKLIPSSVRKFVLNRDDFTCRYCGVQDVPFALDHVQPWSRGGPDTADNLVTACYSCNSRKQDRTPEEAGMPLLAVNS